MTRNQIPKVAIIGAGFAGLTLAAELKNHLETTVFEKARGIGGRLANRRSEFGAFDMGAPFFIAKTADFRRFISPFKTSGSLDIWQPRFVEINNSTIIRESKWNNKFPHYVGVPTMSALAKHIVEHYQLNVQLQMHVDSIVAVENQWEIFANQESQGLYDWVITAIPAQQASALLPEAFSQHAFIHNRAMSPCYTLMIAADNIDLEFQAAVIKNANISFYALNNSKPHRQQSLQCATIHSTNTWAADNLERDLEDIKLEMIDEFKRVMKLNKLEVKHAEVHRWRYANILKQQGPEYLIDPKSKLAACGDWCIRGYVEAAFKSGKGLADALRSLYK